MPETKKLKYMTMEIQVAPGIIQFILNGNLGDKYIFI